MACTSTSQCPASTVCAPSGACEACNVSGGGGALATAVAAAQDGDTLYVCAGTYDAISIATAITVIGARQGADGTVIQGGNPNVTILAGTAAQPVTLEQVRIQNGERGILIGTGGALTMRDSTVSGNSGGASGAGITNDQGTLALTRCTIEDNEALSYTSVGGGLLNRGPATLTDCLVQGNTAARFGGGIYNQYAGIVTLSGTRVTDNTAFDGGSGIDNQGGAGSTVTLQDGSTVCANNPTTDQCVNVTGSGCSDTCPGA